MSQIVCSRPDCNLPAYIRRGGAWRCVKHYRFQQMISDCLRKGKLVPTMEQLDQMSKTMVCIGCRQQMVWTRRESSYRVMSLQHDRSGKMRLLCQSCNSAHKFFPGDTFYKYQITDLSTFCRWCKTQKTVQDFYKSKKTWSGLMNGCKECRQKYYANRKGGH